MAELQTHECVFVVRPQLAMVGASGPSEDFGIGGKCDTPRMTGAIFAAATELGAPGVPPVVRLASQF